MDTIKSSAEISSLLKSGKRFRTPYFTLIVLRNQEQHGLSGRVAFIAGKKLGNAVWRNSAKRRMRSLCREVGGPFDSYDMLLVAKRGVTEAPYSRLLETMRKTVSKAGLQ